MASNLIKTSGSIFMGNPITYSVKAESEPVEGSVSFHRVKLRVTVSGKTYELSTPAKSGETVEFDISSCLRAAADAYEYTPLEGGTVSYPTFVASIEARDVWLKDGVLIDPAPLNGGKPTAQCTAVMGGLSDFERHKSLILVSYSRKPHTGEEIVYVGDDVVVGTSLGETPQSAVRQILASEAGKSLTLADGHRVYVDSTPRNSMQFQFVNSRGVMESARAFQLESEKVSGHTEEHTISRLERFTQFSRVFARKSADRTELTLSSGFVTYEWAVWWAYEFCASSHAWIMYDGEWIPCTVARDDSFTVIDRTKPGMCHVQFTCKPDLNGALW
ncbi:MAG: hypothetical protein MJZ81_10385 [Bacteroidales bacterium]|nr:hypothetical protein [Bacteroidales bacterium]